MSAQPYVLTAATLRHVAICQRRIWLDQHGNPSAANESVSSDTDSWSAASERPPQAIYAHHHGELQRIELSSWEQGVMITRDLMAHQADTIFDAHLELITALDLTDRCFILRCTVDRLQRISRGDPPHYAPILIRTHGRPDDADWLHLDLCAWLLQGSHARVAPGELWVGLTTDGHPRQRIAHEYSEDRLVTALSQAAGVLNAAEKPAAQLAPHCRTCRWYVTCQAAAQQAGALDLLYRVSGKTRQQMQAAGLTTLADIATASLEALLDIKGIGPATAPGIRANAQAWLENRPVQYRTLTIPAPPEEAWMFDLETLEAGGRTLPWCLGWCNPAGETQIALVAPVDAVESCVLPDQQRLTLAPDYETLWLVFADAMAARSAPIYHWTGYDAAVLRSTAPEPVRRQLEPRLHDLHRLFTRSFSLPLKSTSIKTVSVHLGFEWVGTNDWFQAFLDYKQWVETADLAALTRACRYQRADVQSMAWVWRWLVENATVVWR